MMAHPDCCQGTDERAMNQVLQEDTGQQGRRHKWLMIREVNVEKHLITYSRLMIMVGRSYTRLVIIVDRLLMIIVNGVCGC